MSQIIQLKRRNINVYHFTGKVASSSKNMETRVHGGGGGGYTHQGTGYNAPVSISSTTIVHDTLFVIDQENNEKAVQLTDFDLACREGNIISLLWDIVEGTEEGYYFSVKNHSTHQQFIKQTAVKRLISRSLRPHFKKNWPRYLLYIAGLIVAFLLVPFFAVAACIYFIIREIIFHQKEKKNFLSSIQYPTVEIW